MGNAPLCGVNKTQFLSEVHQELEDAAEEWLGMGLLTAERHVTSSELRLPVNKAEVPHTRQCKRVCKQPGPTDLTSSGSQGGALPSRAPRAQHLSEGTSLVSFLCQGDSECRKLEFHLSVGESIVGQPRHEEDTRNLPAFLIAAAAEPGRSHFDVVMRVEFAGVSIRREYSPFRHGKFVEDAVRQMLEESSGNVDLVLFASNYGNCVVEKVFCGGVLCLSFQKGGPGGAMDTFEVQVNADVFKVAKSQRGGESILDVQGQRLTLDQLEKQVKQWCKSFTLEGNKRIPPRSTCEVVRLKLVPFSKVEGLTVPPALMRMDFHRTAEVEKAREALSRAQRREDLPALQEAISLGEAVELFSWDLAAHESAQASLTSLQTREKKKSKLQAAAAADEVMPHDLVRILGEAFEQGYADLPEFGTAEAKLTETIDKLTQKVKDSELTEREAQDYTELLARLPAEASPLAGSSLASGRFAEAARQMAKRNEEKREESRRKTELQAAVSSAMQEIERSPSEERPYEELAAALREVDAFVGRPPRESGDGDAALLEREALVTLKDRVTFILDEKRTMDQTARNFETRLRDASCGDSSSTGPLEAALQDVAAKQQSGALHRARLAAHVVESARKQLLMLLRPELEAHLEKAHLSPHAQSDAAAISEAEAALQSCRRVLQRMEATCRPTCDGECEEMAERCRAAQRALEAASSRRGAQEDAREKLRHTVGSGDPECLEAALRQAKAASLPEAQLLEAEARLRELQTAQRQLRSAQETGDRVHLSAALQEALQQGLKTPSVDEAQQRLQRSKTSGLVTAIRDNDYVALGKAISEAEARGPDEAAEISDVLEQARKKYKGLDKTAVSVAEALGTLSYSDLRSSLQEAQALKIVTDDVQKAENVLAAMDAALQKLQEAASRQPHDLAELQEGLHCARQQGLQAHPTYRKAEEIFGGTCLPARLQWALEEQKHVWVVLCLRRPLPSGDEAPAESAGEVTHPFTVAVAELCHNAQISPEGDSYTVQYIHHALAHMMQLGGENSSQSLQAVLERALEDFSKDPGGAMVSKATLNAQQFNNVGALTKQADLPSTRHLLWLLVCIVEWESGQRIFLHFMSELAQRTADLQNEAESTEHSNRNAMMALQARGAGSLEDDAGGVPLAPEVAPETGPRSGRLPSAPSNLDDEALATDSRVAAVRAVLQDIDHIRKEAEKLQASIIKSRGAVEGENELDVTRLLSLVREASPENLQEARAAVQQQTRKSSKRAGGIHDETYRALEMRLLQLQYRGRRALDGEAIPTAAASAAVSPAAGAAKCLKDLPPTSSELPLATFSSRHEAAASLQDHAFLQLLGAPESARGASQNVDRCFQRVEIYENFSEKTGAVEDEFEKLCRVAVTEARQRCGGRRLIAALKPLFIDLVKRRQRISSMLNTLRNCGLDKVEKNLFRKHLQPRDLLLALAFSSMDPGSSQARMLGLAAKTESPLPFLFSWAYAPQGASSTAGLQLSAQIHWGALRELFCRPSYPLVLSVGSRDTLGKSFLLQYLYALQECHFRGRALPLLRIHAMPSIDLIGDFAREEPLRGVTLADVHSYDPSEELCQSLLATLASCAALLLLHVSLKKDFPNLSASGSTAPSEGFEELLSVLAYGRSQSCPTVLLLLRDADADDSGPTEQRQMLACINVIRQRLARAGVVEPTIFVWQVPPLAGLGQTELTNEVKALRKSRALSIARSSETPTLEDALSSSARSEYRFPSMSVLQEKFQAFAAGLRSTEGRPAAAAAAAQGPKQLVGPPAKGRKLCSPLAERIFQELDSVGQDDSLLTTLFPVAHCHQELTKLLQERVRCLNRGREYLEPEERKRLEAVADKLDREIAKLRRSRQQAPPHALLKTFAELVLSGGGDRITEFGSYVDMWKQERRAPLLEAKLRLRKELDQLVEAHEPERSKSPSRGKSSSSVASNVSAPVGTRVEKLRAELAGLQHGLDQVDVSTDSFWLELMLWHELEKTGERLGLRELDERLTYSICRTCYHSWVKNGNPVHFLHSAPLQFGAFEPLRWHPQTSGASLFGSDFIGDVLRELDRDLGVDVRGRPLLVISVIGVQSSGKSTLMNYLFGCSFATHVGRCTKGLYISLLETKRELIVILDTEGLLSVEARDDVFDKQVALMTMACSDLVIVNNRGELGRHVGDLFQVCLFALYHLKLARISPAIGFVLQCLSMVNQQQQYEWVATVKKSLEESVQELQQKEKPQSFKLQDLVFLDSESIFVMPSAFNDDVQFGLQVSRPTNLYALKALQLREKVFHWIGRAKASQKQRLRESGGGIPGVLPAVPESTSMSSFASLAQWYDHARTVWQTLSMCGTDLLQFRTMRQVLMAQQLQEFCDALVQKYIDAKLTAESGALIEVHTKELRGATSASDVHVIDNAFRGNLDAIRDAVLQEMHQEFDEFVKAHDTKFTDEQVKTDKRFSLMGPLRRKYASVDSQWRSAVHLALEQRSMDRLFEEISERVNDLLLEQGASVNVQNVERVFEEKWNQVMAETLRKQRPNLMKVIQEVVWHFNAALSTLKSQFRKAHIFHGVKSLSAHEIGSDTEISASFLLTKKGVGDALVPAMHPPVTGNSKSQVDNLWIKLVDAMRLEIDQQGQMSDAAALKILNRLNSEMEAVDQLRQLLHRLGSSFVHRMFCEIARATMHYRFQIEQQNFQSRVTEVMSKKQQKLWEIQARVDSGKREVHCAKVWAKTFVDTLDQHFRNAVGRMAREIVSHMSNILTNPGNACELAIERSFTKRNWRHVVMYAIDPSQYLFIEFHKEWEQFKQGLVDQYCQELKNSFGSCLRIAEERMQGLLASGTLQAAKDMTMNQLSDNLRDVCQELVDDNLASVLCSCLPSFPADKDWSLNDLQQFVQFASVELRRYRANMRQTEQTVERRMEVELTRQKANCWKCICGCPARCPGCGTKCNLESENHWPERPHECRRHLYPAFNGWQKQEGRKPFLLHCRAKAQWQIARTRPPIEPGAPERYWDNFQAMLEDEHPDWLDPKTRRPLPSMEPLEDYEEDCTNAPEHIQREIEENRRAWANCKDALLEHFTSMADDRDVEWLDKFKRETGALTAEDFVSIRDELFATNPLESMETMESVAYVDQSFEESYAG